MAAASQKKEWFLALFGMTSQKSLVGVAAQDVYKNGANSDPMRIAFLCFEHGKKKDNEWHYDIETTGDYILLYWLECTAEVALKEAKKDMIFWLDKFTLHLHPICKFPCIDLQVLFHWRTL